MRKKGRQTDVLKAKIAREEVELKMISERQRLSKENWERVCKKGEREKKWERKVKEMVNMI